jgi:hypothetical protein
METDIGSKQRSQARTIPGFACFVKRRSDLQTVIALDRKARSLAPYMFAGTSGELSTGSWIAINRTRHIVEALSEHIMQ